MKKIAEKTTEKFVSKFDEFGIDIIFDFIIPENVPFNVVGISVYNEMKTRKEVMETIISFPNLADYHEDEYKEYLNLITKYLPIEKKMVNFSRNLYRLFRVWAYDAIKIKKDEWYNTFREFRDEEEFISRCKASFRGEMQNSIPFLYLPENDVILALNDDLDYLIYYKHHSFPSTLIKLAEECDLRIKVFSSYAELRKGPEE